MLPPIKKKDSNEFLTVMYADFICRKPRKDPEAVLADTQTRGIRLFGRMGKIGL